MKTQAKKHGAGGLRGALDRVTGPAADALGALGVTPNALTWASVFPAGGALLAAALGHFHLAVIMMLLSGLCDLLDGPLARRTGQTSRFGALLDSTLDRFSDSAPLLGLAFFYATAGASLAALSAAAAVFAGYTVSYVRARAEGLSISLPPLWMRRTERLVMTGVALLLAPVRIDGVSLPAPLTLGMVDLLVVLSLAAAGHAMIEAARLTRVPAPRPLKRAQEDAGDQARGDIIGHDADTGRLQTL